MQANNTVPGGLTKIDEKTVVRVLQEYKIHHAEILFPRRLRRGSVD